MEDRFRLRAWDKQSEMMLFFDGDCFRYPKDKYGNYGYFGKIANDVDYEVMQCTGLKDKYGKLIYEGDIVKYTSRKSKTNPDKKPYTENFKVAWDNNYTGYNLQNVKGINCLNLAIVKTQLEVIGNKYENPELPKGVQE